MRANKTLRDYRIEAGLTQGEAAMMCGISKQCWSRIETGARKGKVETWLRIRLALRIPRTGLLFAYTHRVPKSNNGGRKAKNIPSD